MAQQGHVAGVCQVWNSLTGEMIHELQGHDKQAGVLVPHPTESRLIMTAGFDGKVRFAWPCDLRP